MLQQFFDWRRMLQEAEILGCLGGHPNIVQLRVAAVSQQTLRIYIAMPRDCNVPTLCDRSVSRASTHRPE